MSGNAYTRQVAVNLDQIEANTAIVNTNIALVKAARWRLIRNQRLINESRDLLTGNRLLFAQNDALLGRNEVLLSARRGV